MAAINAINKAPVRSAKAYVARAKKEEAVLPPKPKAKTNEELVDEIPFINHPSCSAHSYRTLVLNYLRSPNLQGLLGTPNRNEGFNGRPWTREDLLLFYTQHCATIHKHWLIAEERRKAIEEKNKNWNPTDAEKLAFMESHMGLRDKLTNEAFGRNDSFCTCCGVLHVDLGVGRVRWEVVVADGAMSANHNPESLRIKDAATGKDMIISWEDA
jgi:hypothetical protein